MLQDVKIIITDTTGKIVSVENQFSAYSFDTQYGVVADAFNLTLVNNNSDIEPGHNVDFIIDGVVSFRGVILRRDSMVGKGETRLSLSGKDRATMLVENYCSVHNDYTDTAPKTIIDALIDQTNFYTKEKGTADTASDSTGFNNSDDITNRNAVLLAYVNESETASRRENKTEYDAEFTALSNKAKFKIEPGDRVFEKIDSLVRSVGFEILYQENGTLYIGDLNKKRYGDEVVYKITVKKDGNNSDAETANLIDDISGRYSTISVTSQAEGYRYTSSFPHVNREKIATDSTMKYKKFYAAHINDDEGSPENVAIRIREDQRNEGYQYYCEVPGHKSNNGEIWKINRYVNVFDEFNKVYQHLVLYGRTFVYSNQTGSGTLLRMGKERINELEI